MQFITIILSLAYAIEAKPLGLGKVFTALQQDIGKPKHASPAAAVRATYLKYGKPVPAHIEAAAAGQQGTVAANPEIFDRSYLSPVSIGSPAQTLMLDFDTGSSDLWVFSDQLPSAQQSGHTVYTAGSSSTAQNLAGSTWAIHYGDGSGASGNVYADTVVIGGVTATSQAVEAATSISTSFANDKNNDGLVGLGFDQINTVRPTKQPTFFSTVKSSLAAPLFAAHLQKGKAGSYDFGFINGSKYTGPITYTPADSSRGYWGFTSTGYAVAQGATQQTTLNLIADTGTSLVYLPDSVLQDYYSQVPGAANNPNVGGYTFPCSSKLKGFTLIVSGNKVTIPAKYIRYAKVNANTCFGGLQSSSGIGLNILGDVFLKSQYVIFDGGNTRLGFAKTRAE